MKTMKKIASLALALLLTVALAAPAFALDITVGGGDGSITITDTAVDQPYALYRLLDLKSFKDLNPADPAEGKNDVSTGSADGVYLYVVAEGWEDFFTNGGAGAAYVEITNVYQGNTYAESYVTWNEGTTAEVMTRFSKAAMDYATEKSLTPVASGTSDEDGITFTNLPLGYYLVDSDVGDLCFLDTTNKDVTIKEKNELPTVEKKIVAADGSLVDTITASYGDTITFQLNIKNPSGLALTINDTMASGLTYKGDLIAAKTNESDENSAAGTVTKNGDANTGDLSFALTGAKGNVTVTYTATLDVNAQTATALTNSVNLTYGDKTTTTSTVTVYTYQFDLVKTTSNGTVLDGATFKLYDEETDGQEIFVIRNADDTYSVVPAGTEGIVDITAGQVTIKGLANGTYYLEETAAPAGYNRMVTRAPVTINSANIDATSTTSTEGENTVTTWTSGVQVINLTGAEMPSTGGIGTTIFYIVGGLLVVGAVVLLVTRKRAGEEE